MTYFIFDLDLSGVLVFKDYQNVAVFTKDIKKGLKEVREIIKKITLKN